MMSASECVRELLEPIAAGVGVDARGELEEDADRISARTGGWSWPPLPGTKHTLLPEAGDHGRPLDSPARGARVPREVSVLAVSSDPRNGVFGDRAKP